MCLAPSPAGHEIGWGGENKPENKWKQMKLGEEEKKTNQKPLELGRVAFYAIRNANAS